MAERAGMVYQTVSSIRGPLLVVEGARGVGYNELVEIKLPDGREMIGSVLDAHSGRAIVQVFGRTEGLDLNVRVRFTGEVVKIPLSDDLIGRVFNGSFKPLDGLPEPVGEEEREIFFSVINPAAREPPSEFIQTGISAIDGMNSLVRGQKLPFFSEAGLPHNIIACQVARQATIPGREEDFAIVFCAMGIKHEEYAYFRSEFERTGALNRAVMILNLADDPVIERIIAPRIALTIAEYLAFDLDMHILVILTDMTNYAEALRSISVAREEVPARKGYPGYLYTDLATIYERAGRIKGKKGSVTLMPILSMVSMFLAQRLTPKPPATDERQAATQRKMMVVMFILFAVMLYNVASGLLLYITVSSLLGIHEQHLIRRSLARDEPAGGKAAGRRPARSARRKRR